MCNFFLPFLFLIPLYQKRTEKRRQRQGKGKARKRVVHKDYTFIPHFQYDLSVYQTPKTVQHQARVTLSPHLVSGQSASKEATNNAAEFGIKFSDGEIFVRPHELGKGLRVMRCTEEVC